MTPIPFTAGSFARLRRKYGGKPPVEIRAQLKELFMQHKGATARLCESMRPPVSPTMLNIWFAGHSNSNRVCEAVYQTALRLAQLKTQQSSTAKVA